MTRKSGHQLLRTLERRFQELRQRAGGLPTASRQELETALQELSQAIAALRAAKRTPPEVIPDGQEAPAGGGSGTPPEASPGHCETILSHIFKAIPDLLTVIDRDFNVIMSNWHEPDFVQEEEKRGQTKGYRGYVPRDRPRERGQVQEVFATGTPHKREWLSPVTGQTLEIHAFPILDEGGRVVLVAEHVRDVTERHLAEKALKESEERFRAIFEIAHDAIFIKDRSRRYTMANAAVGRLFDRPVADLIGRSDEELFGEKATAHIRESDLRVLNGEVVKETHTKPVQGVLTTFHVVKVPLHDDTGEVVGLCGIARKITERKRADKALKESEERFRAIFETAQDAIFIKDRSLQYTMANAAMGRLFDRPVADLIGRSDGELFGEEAAACIRESDLRVLNGEVVKETHTKPVQGVLTTLHVVKVPLHDDTGEVVGLCGIARDITDLKRAEDALTAHLQFLWLLLDTIPNPIFFKDARGAYLGCNKAFADFLGVTREEIIGKTVYDLSPRELGDEYQRMDSAAFQTMGTQVYESQVQMVDGTRRHVVFHKTTFPDPAGGVGGLVGIIMDINDQKRAEEALKESEERFRMLFEYAPDAYFLMDLQGNFLDANRSTEELTGYGRQELIGTNYQAVPLFDDRQNAEIAALLQQAVNGTMLGPVELDLNRKDGGNVIIEAKGLPLHRKGESLLLGIARDITARKQAAEELFKHHLELQETAQRLEQSRNMLQLIIESIPVRVFWKDIDLRYLGCNTLFALDAGLNHPQQLLGQDDFAMGWREQADLYRSDDRQVMESLCPKVNIVEPQTTPAGAKIWLKTSKVPLQMPNGDVFGVLGVYEDITTHYQAEEALRESEARFRAIFEFAPVGVGMADPRGRLLETNQALQALLGYKADELRAMSVQEMTHPEDWPKTLWLQQELHAGERRHYSLEKRYLRKDGGIVWAQVMVALLRDAQGEPQYLIATVVDITARKQAEEALRESEQRFRDITDYAAEWVWEMDPQGKYTYSSPVVEQLLGYAPEEVLGKYFYEFFLPDQREELKNAALAAFAAKQPFRDFLNPNLHKNGQIVWLSTSGIPILDEAGNLQGYRGADIDITERREAEALSRNLIANSPVGIYLIQNRKFQLVNQWFFTITGYGKDESLNLEPLDLVHPEDREATRENAVKMLRGLSSIPYEYRTITKGGEIKWIMETLSSIQYQGKRAVLGYFMEITQRKALEEQLLQAQKMEAVGRLAGGVAHDFNNLLMAITGYGELMRAKVHKGDPLYGHLENILKAGDRAAALTQQLLTFSRRQIVHPQVIDLNRVILDLEPMLRRLIGEDLDLEVVTALGAVAVKADPGQLGQIIMNLVVNARDAMPKGGRLTLKTAAVDFTVGCHSRFGLAPPGPYVMLVAQDTGFGMDEATQTHAFEPFFTTKEMGKGTGLGLSTVYGIVKQSGGYLDLESKPGAGSTFTVYLPRLDQVVEPPKVKIPITASFRGEETVLLVEDEEVLRGLLAKFLRLYGYTVLEARHGGEALLTCERHQGPIHLMVTDVVMPQMSGRELANRLTPLRPEMKVLYMSGYTDDALVQHGVEELSVAFLQKPFKPIDLARRVHAVLHPPASR